MFYKIASILVFAVVIGGCGGGGSSSEPSAQTPQASEAMEIIAALNSMVRIPAGLSPVKANPEVMAAAQKHADYLAINPVASSSHPEIKGATGFIGVMVSDRIIAAGYPNLALDVEVIAQSNGVLQTNLQLLRSLINSPYHGLGLMYMTPDVGVGLAITPDGKNRILVINFASKSTLKVYLPLGAVTMWPCNGIDNILSRTTGDERPNPISGRNLATDPIGTPVIIVGNKSEKGLSLTTYSIVNANTGQSVDIIKVLGADDADGLPTNERALLPSKPLATNTPYVVMVAGSTDGLAFSKTCKFTTGAALQ